MLNKLLDKIAGWDLPPALQRYNRAEVWLCLASALFYVLSFTFASFSDNPTRFSAALFDLQLFFRSVSVVFGGMLVAILCTRHSVAGSDNTRLENSAIYAVRAAIVIALVMALS